MSGIILLVGKLGVAGLSFVGMASLSNWFSGDKKQKGGNNNAVIKRQLHD